MKTENIFIQDGATIRTLHPSSVCQARIYSEEQRRMIRLLLHHNFFPHHTSVGARKMHTEALERRKIQGQTWQGL